MYQSDFDQFAGMMADLCVAFDKPVMDDRVRVFWEALKAFPLPAVRKSIVTAMLGKKFPTPAELKPQIGAIAAGVNIRHPNEDLVDYVMKVLQNTTTMTPRQLSQPWTHIVRFYDAPDMNGVMRQNHGAEFVGLEVPGTDGSERRVFWRRDIPELQGAQ